MLGDEDSNAKAVTKQIKDKILSLLQFQIL